MIFNNQNRIIKGFELNDPVPRLIEDSDDISTIFKETKIIPYASTKTGTGDSLRSLLVQLSKLSTTHAGCIKAKLDFGFIGNIRVETDSIYTDPVEIDNTRYEKYIEAVKNTEYSTDIFNYFKNVARQYLTLGDVHIELFMYEHDGKYFIKYNHLNTTKNYVIADSAGKVYHYVYSKKLGDKGEVTPFFPEFKKYSFGYKSILHIKNGIGYYGEPDSIDSLLNQYNEFQLKQYNNKQTDNGFMGMTIMEIEKDNPETSIGGYVDDSEMQSSDGSFAKVKNINIAEKLKENFTNKGETPQSIVLFERGYGSSGMVVHTVPPITNEKFFATMGQLNEDDIILSHRWSRRLLGLDVSNGLNSSAFMDDFIIKMNTVIADLQNAIISPHDKVNEFLFDLNGETDLLGLSRRIINPLAKIYENSLNNNNNNNNVSASSSSN